MKVVFHEEFYRVYTSDPAAAPGRLEPVIQAIEATVDFIEAQPATVEQLEYVHEKCHIERIQRMDLFDIASLAAGGAILAATIGMTEPCFGLVRPPGHHASAGSCWGFCYFNNIAVALEVLKRRGAIQSAFVLDFDLHFGDGTVNILGNRSYAAIHNVEGSTRKAFLDEISTRLAVCSADIIGISAGFDNHREDWGGLLETEDYRKIGQMVRKTARRNDGGCFAVLEGGYNRGVLGDNVLALIEGLDAGKD
jgi:acetoin utilization deacetylase AcuC-like enzyme